MLGNSSKNTLPNGGFHGGLPWATKYNFSFQLSSLRPAAAGRAPGVVVSPSAAKVIAAGAVPGTGVAVPGRVGATPPPITVSAMAKHFLEVKDVWVICWKKNHPN